MIQPFQNVTQAQVDSLKAKLAEGGAKLTPGATPNIYTIDGHGVNATATYDPAAHVLTVVINHKPWIVPESAIASQITEALASA
jgi:hypothetical protein